MIARFSDSEELNEAQLITKIRNLGSYREDSRKFNFDREIASRIVDKKYVPMYSVVNFGELMVLFSVTLGGRFHKEPCVTILGKGESLQYAVKVFKSAEEAIRVFRRIINARGEEAINEILEEKKFLLTSGWMNYLAKQRQMRYAPMP